MKGPHGRCEKVEEELSNTVDELQEQVWEADEDETITDTEVSKLRERHREAGAALAAHRTPEPSQDLLVLAYFNYNDDLVLARGYKKRSATTGSTTPASEFSHPLRQSLDVARRRCIVAELSKQQDVAVAALLSQLILLASKNYLSGQHDFSSLTTRCSHHLYFDIGDDGTEMTEQTQKLMKPLEPYLSSTHEERIAALAKTLNGRNGPKALLNLLQSCSALLLHADLVEKHQERKSTLDGLESILDFDIGTHQPVTDAMLSKMKTQTLIDACQEAGVPYPLKAKKAEAIAVIGPQLRNLGWVPSPMKLPGKEEQQPANEPPIAVAAE